MAIQLSGRQIRSKVFFEGIPMPVSTEMSRLKRGAVLAATVLALASSPVMAQQPATPRPAAPAAPRPAQPAAAAPTSNIVAVKPEPSQTTWTKVCGKDPANNKEICYTTRDFVSDQGQPVLAVAVYTVAGDPTKVVRFLLPLGLLIQPGSRYAVDSAAPQGASFAICFPNGCFAENNKATDAFINSMKRGANLNVSVQNQGGAEVTFQVPLAGFATAFDGAAIDPKVLEDQQKALQEQIEKQQDQLRRRLQGDTPPAGSPAPAPGTSPVAPKP
jgi:invasion protein IalB